MWLPLDLLSHSHSAAEGRPLEVYLKPVSHAVEQLQIQKNNEKII
tara:strand:- start:430 stop:564 length:135 start_codon:yes stop_codon:yes gene_type:complete